MSNPPTGVSYSEQSSLGLLPRIFEKTFFIFTTLEVDTSFCKDYLLVCQGWFFAQDVPAMAKEEEEKEEEEKEEEDDDDDLREELANLRFFKICSLSVKNR